MSHGPMCNEGVCVLCVLMCVSSGTQVPWCMCGGQRQLLCVGRCLPLPLRQDLMLFTADFSPG